MARERNPTRFARLTIRRSTSAWKRPEPRSSKRGGRCGGDVPSRAWFLGQKGRWKWLGLVSLVGLLRAIFCLEFWIIGLFGKQGRLYWIHNLNFLQGSTANGNHLFQLLKKVQKVVSLLVVLLETKTDSLKNKHPHPHNVCLTSIWRILNLKLLRESHLKPYMDGKMPSRFAPSDHGAPRTTKLICIV